MNKILSSMGFTAFSILVLFSLSFAEEVTIATYYPAPYGSYNELQLYPHSPAVVTCDDAHAGVMYYDSADKEIKVCMGAAEGWVPIGYWELNGINLTPHQLDWNVGIGTSTPAYKLEVNHSGGGHGSRAVSVSTDGEIGVYATTPYNTSYALYGETTGIGGSGVYGSGNVGVDGQGRGAGVRGQNIGKNAEGLLGVGTLVGVSNIGVYGWSSGVGYAGYFDGKVYVTGNVGLGIQNPQNKLDVSGGVAIGSGYVGTTTPVNGLIVEGNVGIGTLAPSAGAKLNVHGGSAIGIYGEGDGLGVVGYNPTNKWGVLGQSVSGVGVSGISRDGAGVHGESSTGPGGTFWSASGPALITRSGNVGIGTENPQGILDVNGTIYQRGTVLHADYVFEPDYKLESIEEHSAYMWQHKRLKGLPKANQDKEGKDVVELGALNRGMLEELEKAHIYIEHLHKRIKALEEKIDKLQK